MATKVHDTPMLDELDGGPWPSFIDGIKRLRDDHPEARINGVANSLLGQLEHSYETRKGYWKGGAVSVYGYGSGIIPRFSEVASAFEESKEFPDQSAPLFARRQQTSVNAWQIYPALHG